RTEIWLLTFLTFIAFAIVSTHLGIRGVASCGCFGTIRTSPWTAFSIDLIAVFVLLLSRPGLREFKSTAMGYLTLRFTKSITAFLGIITSVVAVVICTLILIYGSIDRGFARIVGRTITINSS